MTKAPELMANTMPFDRWKNIRSNNDLDSSYSLAIARETSSRYLHCLSANSTAYCDNSDPYLAEDSIIVAAAYSSSRFRTSANGF